VRVECEQRADDKQNAFHRHLKSLRSSPTRRSPNDGWNYSGEDEETVERMIPLRETSAVQ
jgi:hypothetical protein